MKKMQIRNLIIVLMLSMLSALLFSLYMLDTDSYQENKLRLTFFISSTVLALFLLKKEQCEILRGQYFTVSNLFLLGFCIVHFQFYIDLLLGYTSTDSIYTISQGVLNKSAIISTVALCFFCIGYISKIKFLDLEASTRLYAFQINLSVLKLIFIGSFLAVIIFTPWSYFRSGYISVELSQAALKFNQVFLFCAISYIALHARNLTRSPQQVSSFYHFAKSSGFLVPIVLTIYCILTLMSGDRGPIIRVVLACFGCYVFLTRKKYNIVTIFVAILLASSVVTLLAHVRYLDTVSSPLETIQLAIDRQSTFNKRDTISSGTEELARSVRTLHAAVDYTEKNGYSFGYYKILGMFGIVPGAGRLLQPVSGVDKYAKSTNLITEHIDADHGMGTSVVADLWLDFGLVGIVLVFFAFGWLLRVIDVHAYARSNLGIFVPVFVAAFLVNSIYISRGVILDVFRDGVHMYILALVGVYAYKFLQTNFQFPSVNTKR